MNFEKIEMIGFKSFADKVEITFDNGVTGIVGPNGCGKSNIADAIRWVLGEQSAKNMRGSSMTDVIFNGTQNRKSLSYCEVSLYFDNSNRIFKSCDYNEVILTRKLFRSGESEYYVNKQPSLLREIVRLLHECGVSKNGYSIISQGKVSEILSSKPEDRRTIFEEAVGIAQAKAKKLETERKLERVRDNLVRIFDVTSLMEKQLEPLSRAAEKTKKFVELSNQLKYHEINNYLYKYDNASVIKDKINTRIQGLIEETETRTDDLEKTNNAYNDHMRELGEIDAIINALHDEILEKSVSQEKLDGQTKVYNEKISYFKNEIARLQSDINQSTEKISYQLKAIEAKKEALVDFTGEKRKLSEELEALNHELTTVLSAITQDENAASKAHSTMLKAAENLADISKNLGSLDKEKYFISEQHREVIDKVNNLTLARQQLEIEKTRINNDISEGENTKASLLNQVDCLEKAISANNNTISELSNKIYKLNMDINSLDTNRKIYSGLKDSFDGYPNAVKRLMLSAKENSALNSRIKGVVATIIKTDKKYEVAIETSLGNAVQHIVTDSPEDAKYLIEYLKRSEGGRVTFLPVTSVKPHMDGPEIISALGERGVLGLAAKLISYEPYYENVIRFLLGNTLIVDNIENAVTIANKYRFAFKIVTLEGEVLNSSGSMTGGSRRQNQANLLSTERMIENLSENIRIRQAEVLKLTDKKDKLTEQTNNDVEQLDKLNEQLQQIKLDLSALTVKSANIQALIDANEQDLTANNKIIETVTQKLEEIAAKFTDIQEGNKKLEEQKLSASTDADRHKSEHDMRAQRRDDIINRISAIRSRDSFLESEINSANNDINRLQSEIDDNHLIINRCTQNIESDTAIIDGFYKEIERILLDSEINTGVKELKDKLNFNEERKNQLNIAVQQDDLKRQVLNAELNKLSAKRHDEELAISKVDSELEYMQQRVADEYSVTYESCLPLRDPEYDINMSNEEITKLKRRIGGLGSINPNAIEEYRQQSEEYQSLKTQQEDLEKAEADLKEVLKTIRSEMLNEFNTGFEQIRTHFKRIFKELFGGGSADLIIDYSNADDPLNAGVEIVAEPPGKKLQKISLLSGGEMALTAIAILFAILKLRPMPFCVLDEIEAALDDANVERFARYLKKFSNETQFIVITHKKVTMELADSLFGVTMQEKGVSKIVSVKLSEINETMTD